MSSLNLSSFRPCPLVLSVVIQEKSPTHTWPDPPVESGGVSSEPRLLQDKHPSAPRWTGAPHPSLATLRPLRVHPELGDPEMDTALEVWPHPCPAREDNPCPAPGGHTVPDPGQVPLAILGHLGTLMATVQPAVHQCHLMSISATTQSDVHQCHQVHQCHLLSISATSLMSITVQPAVHQCHLMSTSATCCPSLSSLRSISVTGSIIVT
ncbi:hypothetical protein DUI87_35494 [Hirundo rustica rustica]|uniref:Uncharacterized protein n=1 Tax=Hirundo rustica rustica TaxID=333673 RepID=A0A3M0IMD6_HIRRU|nr:hypothetical protein DUI87_35494 [Hirundo rustica rustica]